MAAVTGGHRPLYTVAIWPEDTMWVARVTGMMHGNPDVIDTATCAPTKTQIEPMARDLIATVLDAPESDFDVEFEYEAYP